jgi:hypothetical protein
MRFHRNLERGSLEFTLIIAAWQTDATRVITYRMPDAGLLKSMSIASTPHTLSHYGSNASLHALNLQRTKKWMQLYSGFIDLIRLGSTLSQTG